MKGVQFIYVIAGPGYLTDCFSTGIGPEVLEYTMK